MRTQHLSSSLFVGPKCASAIPTTHPLVRDVVIQASFDASVTRIEFLPSIRIGRHTVVVNSVVITKDTRRCLLDIVDARPLRTIDDEGLLLLALEQSGIETIQISESAIRREPRCSNAREIWRSRFRKLSSRDRLNILDALDESGPLSIAQLVSELGDSDCWEKVLSLACEGEVHIDIDAAIDSETVVRRRCQIESASPSFDLAPCKSEAL
jgi:hypothetical protein